MECASIPERVAREVDSGVGLLLMAGEPLVVVDLQVRLALMRIV